MADIPPPSTFKLDLPPHSRVEVTVSTEAITSEMVLAWLRDRIYRHADAPELMARHIERLNQAGYLIAQEFAKPWMPIDPRNL